MLIFFNIVFFFNDTATTEIYTILFVGSVRCVQETGINAEYMGTQKTNFPKQQKIKKQKKISLQKQTPMELFLDQSPKSKFLAFLANLTHLSKKQVNTIYLSQPAQKILSDPEGKFKLPSLPCLITAEGNFLTSIFSIASYFTQISYTEKILFNKPQEIISVIEFLERKEISEIIVYFNQMLEDKSFLVGQHLTLADIALFSYVQNILVLYTDEKKWEVCNLYRWFLHIQGMPNVKEYLQRNSIQLALKPKQIVEQEKSKAQLKKEAKQQQKAGGKNEESKKQEGQQQKPKQQPKPQQSKPQTAAAKTGTRPKIPGEVKPEHFYIFDIRIAQITNVWKHESSAKLYCEKMTTGTKQFNVASGLQNHIPIDKMKGLVVLLTNLKERKLAGFTSEGMVMCASIKEKKDEEKIELLRLEKDEPTDLGGRVLLEGVKEAEGYQDVTDKDGVVGKLLQEMKVDKEGFATFLGKRWVVNGKFVKADTLKDCIIS
eukprot:TRINITY_DN761_c0_g1_i1.p1 TRINITY_DN761_c0_g1~~TRINITY_DN761_c0_g1_i1.p1  ORF type:complete len:488 (+),score=100.10 TRINITY_DN761_c0_g1_i1:52-1515(+)